MEFHIRRTELNNPCPCRECADRNENCHAICEAYITYRGKCDEALEERHRAKELNMASRTKWTESRRKGAFKK